ncbi:MAG: LTA synthase family protein, partial [Fibrobacter sp.]|nr:LTA synthase family protein [Fibrobacter sp.]
YLFVYVIWTGNARMAKLRPVVTLVYNELFPEKKLEHLNSDDILILGKAYQNLWQKIEGDSLWIFDSSEVGKKLPLYRIPQKSLAESEALKARRAEKPNFILFLLESHRGLNVGFMNPDETSPTPFLDSIAKHSHAWVRMHASGLPTTGGVLSTHIGIPHHSRLAQATDLAHVNLPSFASVLTDSGYTTHYFSAADPAWDNLGVWMAKWYTAEHYDRNFEDDSSFFDKTVSAIRDSLVLQDKPFLATVMSRSNHYPFNFAAGMTDEEKNRPLQERIKVTMGYTDRQLARFIHSIENEPWYQNTYVIIMADHGFPLGENDVSTMNGSAYSNATWIPFLIHGKNMEQAIDTTTAAQIDVGVTILELAGIAVPSISMGHNLLRGYGSGLSLGAYSKVADIGFEGYRLIDRYPLNSGSVDGLFAESDTHQKQDLSADKKDVVKKLESLIDTLIRISDYTLETGF